MKSLIHEHPNEEVRSAAIRLLDALLTWQRTTGRLNLVIIKDSIGCEYRAMCGVPVPAHMTDKDLLNQYGFLSQTVGLLQTVNLSQTEDGMRRNYGQDDDGGGAVDGGSLGTGF